MSTVMSVEDRIADLILTASTCLENMFHIPAALNRDIYQFSTEWFESGKKPKYLDDILTNKDCLYVVALAGFGPCETVVIDSDDYDDVEAGEDITSVFSYDTPYNYGDFFVALIVASHQLYALRSGMDDEIKLDMIETACVNTASAYMALRRDTMSKIITVENMDTIAKMVVSWKELFEAIDENGEDDSE